MKKIMAICIPLLVIIIIIVIILLMLLQNQKNIQIGDPPFEEEPQVEVNTKIQKMQQRNMYYVVESCVRQFYRDIYFFHDNSNTQEQRDIFAQRIWDKLDSEYKEEFEITKENLGNRFQQSEEQDIMITSMYMAEKSVTISRVFVIGTTKDVHTKEEQQFILMVTIDMTNSTFSIGTQEYMEKLGYSPLKIGQEIEIQVEEIPKNENNGFRYRSISNDLLVKDYFRIYKDYLNSNPKKAYELLREDYREKRFSSFEIFEEFITDKQQEIIQMNLEKYIVNKEGKLEFICVDQFQNYYIFEENSVMDFSVQLDSYTIPRQEWIQEYEKADEAKKVALNIDKFFQMINAKDYEQAYSLLAQEFRNNYFTSLEDFKTYVKNNFFESNEVGYQTIEKQSGLYVQTIQIKDKKGKDTKIITKRFVVQLQKGTNFVLSFQVE